MSAFTGTRPLVRLVLRRDRLRLPVWVVAITVVTAGSADAVQGLYDTPAKVAGYQATVGESRVSWLLNGRPYGLDTVAGITAYETTATALLGVALMAVFTVVRHTRAEEESGRAELLRGTVSGRHAPTAAAVAVAAAASLLVGLLDTAVLVAVGMPLPGSVLHGAGLAAVGLVFTAVGAAAAQVTASARTALGISGGAVGALFLVRGLGDVGDTVLTWLSPFGWALGIDVFGARRWWLLLPLVGLAAVVLGGTGWLTAHRDAGAGLLQPRGGRDRASRLLVTPLGLAARLQRGALIGWAASLLAVAVLFGAVGREVVEMVDSNPQLAEALGATRGQVLDAYFATVLAIIVVLATGFAVSSALRLRGEETSGRAEAVLATSVSRMRWATGWLAVTLVGTLVDLLLVGVGAGGTHALTGADPGAVARLAASTVALAPASLVLVGGAVVLVGWVPRWRLTVWAVLAFAFVQVYLGGLLDFPGWLSGVSPFDHLAAMPLEDFAAAPAAVLLGLGAGLVLLGLGGLRRRDLG